MFDALSQLTPLAAGGTGASGALIAWLYLQLRKQKKALKKIQEITDATTPAEEKVSQIKFILLWVKSDPTLPSK